MRTSTLSRTRALKLPPLLDSIIRQALDHRRLDNTYEQVGHGLAIADWVYFNGTNWLKADRDSSSSLADGVISHVDGNQFDVLSQGFFVQASGLTAGDIYYLSSTAGAITNTLPTSGKAQIIGKALSTTSLSIQFFNGDAPALTPDRVDIYVDNPSITPALTIEQDGTGDATLRLLLTAGQAISIGIDNTDGDKFKISDNSGGVGTNDLLIIDPATGDVGIGVSPTSPLHVSGKIHTTGEIEIDGDLNHDGSNIGFFGTVVAAQAAAYTVTNGLTDRTYDANATSVEELADVIGTLIADLKTYGLLQ